MGSGLHGRSAILIVWLSSTLSLPWSVLVTLVTAFGRHRFDGSVESMPRAKEEVGEQDFVPELQKRDYRRWMDGRREGWRER